MKRNYKQGASRGNQMADTSVADLAANAGRLAFSPAAREYMPPSKPKRIDPNSPEGKQIAAKYTR